MTDNKSKDKFSARAPYLAYIYQGIYALYLILRSENPNESISIEKLDDIDFSGNKLVQVKHHVNDESLSDGSEDLWKTIRVWSEHLINGHISLNDDLILTLITTAKANEGHIAALLRDDTKRDPVEACKKLCEYAKLHSAKHKKDSKLKVAFDTFQEDLTETQRFELVKKIWIIDGSPNISEIPNKIKNMFHGIHPDHRDAVFERLMGWWESEIIKHLKNESSVPISKLEVEQRLADIAYEYGPANLPTRYKHEECPINLEQDNRRFVAHLKKVTDLKKSMNRRGLEKAILYFHRASSERSDWLKTTGLLKLNEISSYEQRLIDKWEEQVEDVGNSVNGDFEDLDDTGKKRAGWDIFSKTRSLNIKIRQLVEEEYIMQGSYHILANEDRVAWHPDEILEILSTEEND